VSTDFLGIDQGPIIMMIENHRTGSVWERMKRNPDLARGLAAAGFTAVSSVPDQEGGAVRIVELGQNAPNPFRGATTIAYRVARPGPVTLRVYDLRGRCVRTIVDQAENTELQQMTLNAGELPSGIYSYSLESSGQKLWRRCIVVK
jgi:hypothetical protein